MDTKEKNSMYVDESSANEKIQAAREVAESEISEPAFTNPVPRHRGYTAVVLAVLGLCAAFLIVDLFYYAGHKDRKVNESTYTTTMKQQPVKTVALPGLTVVGHQK